jgi:single-strand DNA-binding protein
MSEGLNRVMLIGTLGADPELRFTQSGQAVLNMRIATNESYLDKDKVRQERTEWHSVTLWGTRGEALVKILGKGSTIFVEGSLRTSSYEKNGEKRYKTEVVASNVILSGKWQSQGGKADPSKYGASGAGANAKHTAPDQDPTNAHGFDRDGGDDLPF